ncbi:hypothetical protein, partial [Ellagibacter isourolithinifaciens]|uniref:hypothetical protein n=1 Tax=Ellagibacter isourolithinifaciens TaxID=2137581 RepID=UPI003AB04076
DIISIASAICPVDEHASDSFWPLAAANYLTAYIAYVLEALPDDPSTRTLLFSPLRHVSQLTDRLAESKVSP